MSKETSPTGRSQTIEVQGEGRTVFLTTTSTDKEVFLSIEDALKTKKRKKLKKTVEAWTELGIGELTLVGGVLNLINKFIEFSGNELMLLSHYPAGIAMVISGVAVVAYSLMPFREAKLISDQVKKIELKMPQK
jgi:hypothetical protein